MEQKNKDMQGVIDAHNAFKPQEEPQASPDPQKKAAPEQPAQAKASAMPEDHSQQIADLQKKLEEKTALAESHAAKVLEQSKELTVRQSEIAILQQEIAITVKKTKIDSVLRNKVTQQLGKGLSIINKEEDEDLYFKNYFSPAGLKCIEAIDNDNNEELAKLSKEMGQQLKIKMVVNSIINTLEKSNRFYTSGVLVKAKEIKEAFYNIPMEDRLKLVSGNRTDDNIKDFLKALLKQRAWLFKTSEAKSHSLFNKKMNEPAAKKEPEGHKPKPE